MAVVERFKQESMYGLIVYQEKKGRCRELAVVGGGGGGLAVSGGSNYVVY